MMIMMMVMVVSSRPGQCLRLRDRDRDRERQSFLRSFLRSLDGDLSRRRPLSSPYPSVAEEQAEAAALCVH
jgi:hypothetical protein